MRGGAAARQCAGHPRDRGRVVSAAAPAAAGLSPGAVSRARSTGALRRRRSSTAWMPSRGSTTWWRWPRTPCCSATPSPPCSWRRPRARPAARPRTSTPTPAIGPARGDRDRRVVIKAEVVRLGDREPRDNQRFVVTNLRQTPRFVYERIYCARGDIENRIKELLDGLQIDRTSCCRFWPINCACSSPPPLTY